MITRKYSYLVGENITRKVEIKIIDENAIGLLHVINRGYGLYNTKEGFENSLVIVDTKLKPFEFKTNSLNKEQFTHLVKINLDVIYSDKVGMKEYEKKHPEYLLIELLDEIQSSNCEILTNDDEQSKILEKGFDKLDIETIKNTLI